MNQGYAPMAMTSNAEKIYRQFSDQVRQVGELRGISWECLQPFLQTQLLTPLAETPGQQINAETMMNAIDKIGRPEEFVSRYQVLCNTHSLQQPAAPAPKAQPLYRQLHRSNKRKLIAGVCGGIAEYFHIEPLLVRAAFIICCSLAPATLFLYPLLWWLLPREPRAQLTKAPAGDNHPLPPNSALVTPPASYHAPQPAMPDAPQEKTPALPSKSLLRRMFSFAAFLLMSLVVYLPATLLLLAGTSFCLWGIFYPIVSIDGFRFSFSELGTPGLVLASFAALLSFCLFLLVIAIMSRLHFTSKFLKKSSLVALGLLVLLSLFGIVSAAGIIVFENQVPHSVVYRKEIALNKEQQTIKLDESQWQALHNSDVGVRELIIYTDAKATAVMVKCTVQSRGRHEEQSKKNSNKLVVTWPDSAGFFPNISKESSEFHFEQANLQLVLPAGKNLEIIGSSLPRLRLSGKFGQVQIDSKQVQARLEDIVADSLTCKNQMGICVSQPPRSKIA